VKHGGAFSFREAGTKLIADSGKETPDRLDLGPACRPGALELMQRRECLVWNCLCHQRHAVSRASAVGDKELCYLVLKVPVRQPE
jgi:hypothetical protein